MFVRALASLLLLLPLSAIAQTPAEVPRLGVDYVVLNPAQPTYAQGKIEVAEVFGYSCGHCATFQPQVNAWKKRLGAEVRFTYVPGVFGGMWDNFARAYFAAEAMGVLDKTHDAVFKAVHLERRLSTGSLEEIAGMYADLAGVDKAAFLSTMNSFAVNAKLSRAKQFAQRTGVTGTPTIIVAGKYRVVTSDRGLGGLISTTDWLLARERAAAKSAAPVPAPKG